VDTKNGQKRDDIKSRLLKDGCKFKFFQAVRLLESFKREGEDENIRFQPDVSLLSPTSPIKEIKLHHSSVPGKEIYLMIITFMGLYGINAPVPIYFTELISSHEADSEPLQEFLDIFNHRLIFLFYQAWKKYRYHLTFRADGRDPLSNHLWALSGLNSKILKTLGITPIRLIRYTGILSMRTRSPAGLSHLLQDFFNGIRVKIKEFIPQWKEIPVAYQNRLGEKNSQLGVNFSLGNRVLSRGWKFRITIGPISLAQYESFLPGSKHFNTLKQLVNMYTSQWLEFDVEFIVKGEDIPSIILSAQGRTRLGFTAWLVSQEPKDASVVFEV
jgi:type VI secretion system protein ImpH